MANPRRKTTEEPAVRSAAGSRLARERMVQTRSSPDTQVERQAPCIVVPLRSSESSFDGDASSNWLGDAKPEPVLRFSGAAADGVRRFHFSRSTAMSVIAHAALLGIALLAFPKVAEFPAGGETAIPVEMVFVTPDMTDAPAAESGAKQEFVKISVPLPEAVTEAIVVRLPEVAIAPPVQIERPEENIISPEPPAPVVQPTEQLLPAPVAPEGNLPPRSEPAALPAPSKPRPVVDQERVKRNFVAAREARRQEKIQEAQQERREEQRQERIQAHIQAQINERRKQQAQRAVVDAQRRAAAPRPTQAQSETGTGTQQVTRQARQAGGSTQGAAANAGKAEIASYRSRVLAHLARYKNYPETAQDAGIQGRATVSFTITRAGGVTSASLAGSSGAGVLDQATLAMVRRAQPFPAMPAGGPASMSFTAVIRYDLR